MGRKFQVARLPSGTAPNTQSMQYDVAQVFKNGAVLVDEGGATGEVVEAGADPALIVGVAQEDANSKPGYDMANSPTVVTGRVQEVSVAIADRSQIFSGRGVNGGTDPTTPVLGDVDKNMGIVKVGNDWCIDFADAVNTRVKIVDIDIDNKIYFFKFLEANLARP